LPKECTKQELIFWQPALRKKYFERVKEVVPGRNITKLAKTIVYRHNATRRKRRTTLPLLLPELPTCRLQKKLPKQHAFLGNRVERIYDVGVAGIHRLFSKIELIRGAKVIIVVAGMEGALPSVVGGLVDKPVIAVPTSVGYGANLGGVTALLAMLNSCAAGISVVNIDNGFGAACQAV
jgi:pyridinium-3,5-biscarboxylic acid mononucleotide synthase